MSYEEINKKVQTEGYNKYNNSSQSNLGSDQEKISPLQVVRSKEEKEKIRRKAFEHPISDLNLSEKERLIKEIKETIFKKEENPKDTPYKNKTPEQINAVFNSPISGKEKDGLLSRVKSLFGEIKNGIKDINEKKYYKKGIKYIKEFKDKNRVEEIKKLIEDDFIKARETIITIGKGGKFNPQTGEYKIPKKTPAVVREARW